MALCAFCISDPGDVYANEKQNTSSGAVGDAGQNPACYKKINVKGRPHRISTVASLSAVRMWSQLAMKHGDSYSMWHNAKGTSVKCEKLPRSDYYACFAAGKPCRATSNHADASGN